MMMRTALTMSFVVAGVLSFGSWAHAGLDLTAKVFEDKNKEKQLFTFERSSEIQDARTIVNTVFKDMEGQVAVTEYAEFAKDKLDQIQLYRQSQKQVGAEGSVEVKDGKAHFTYTQGGKTKKATEKAVENLVVTPSVLSYLQKRWSKIEKGEVVKIRLAVLDRLETVGFEFSKDKEIDHNGQKAIVVKMKPSSFIIAALVDPLHFYLSKDGQRLLEIHGRTTVKRKDGNSYKDLDAVTVYESPTQAAAPSEPVQN